MEKPDFIAACHQYLQLVHAINGVYLDGTMGFEQMRRLLVDGQTHARACLQATEPEKATSEYLDGIEFLYGTGDPNTPEARIQHRCTQGEYKARNAKGGANHAFLANVCLVMLYQFWEDRYRGEIAQALGRRKNQIALPVMGDLRILRRSIIHHAAMALPEVEKCEVLRWFRRGQPIALSAEQFEIVINAVAASIAQLLVAEHGEERR